MTGPSAPMLATVVLDCADAHELATFYSSLLGWKVKRSEADWVIIEPPDGGTHLAFQSEPWYEPPVWPEEPGQPHKMLHLDLWVDDLEEVGARAQELGAKPVDLQPQVDVRVFIDPAGHPFCLFVD